MHHTNIETLRDEAKRQLQLLKELLQKAQKKGLVEAPAKAEHSRATFDTESLPKVLEVLDGESHKLENLDMVLAVVGTMKAGKSTSINAIVGAEVLPNRNRPMTALPTLIRHTPGVLQPRLVFEKVQPLNNLLATLGQTIKTTEPAIMKALTADADMAQLLAQIQRREPFASRQEGEQGIFNFLKSLNDLVRLCFALGAEFPFAEYATVDAMPVIEVEFSHLKDTPATQGRLTLLDTPGPNEAGQQHLRHMLKDQLKKASAVLAVLDYTQLKSDADAQVRENLLEISGTAKGRMYALVNKFDQKDRNSDDKATVKNYVAQTLMKGAMAGDSVFPVSAKQGYLASRARNEIERNGKLQVQATWAKDFAEEAFGRRWEKFIDDPKEVKEGADELWQESGFAQPLEQVIVEAHQNAALEALRSAASKLDDIARSAGNFFKANVGAMKKSAAELQRNIDHLQKDIENIDHIENSTGKALKGTLKNMRGKMNSAADQVQNEIHDALTEYFKEGKRIEFDSQGKRLKDKKSRKKKEAESPSIESFASRMIEGFFSSRTELRTFDSNGQVEQDFDPSSLIITFNEKSAANDFREKIEKSIRQLMYAAEENLKSCIQDGINGFSEELEKQRKDSLNRIKESVQKNIEEFDIDIRLPSAQEISLDTSVSSILRNAVEEKSKTVTRSRRKSGVWGAVCRWFNTDDWGWEDYQTTEDYYQVDIQKIAVSCDDGVKNLFTSANEALDSDIYPQLQQGVDDFFSAFREKVEHIRGDLMSGIQKHSLDQAQKAVILEESTKMAREASELETDCAALNASAETLRREEGVTTVRGEVLA